MGDIELARRRLEAKREEIERQSQQAAQSRETVELDQQSVGRLSRMDAMQVQEMAKAQEARRRHDLVRIDMAMRRIEAGEYGYCIECDAEIPDGRLAIDPMAEKCVDCA